MKTYINSSTQLTKFEPGIYKAISRVNEDTCLISLDRNKVCMIVDWNGEQREYEEVELSLAEWIQENWIESFEFIIAHKK